MILNHLLDKELSYKNIKVHYFRCVPMDENLLIYKFNLFLLWSNIFPFLSIYFEEYSKWVKYISDERVVIKLDNFKHRWIIFNECNYERWVILTLIMQNYHF